MLRVAGLDVSRSGNSRARIDQIRRIEDAGAVLALIAARSLITAVLAGADDISIRQEPTIIDRIDLPGNSFLEKAILDELMIEMLGDLVVQTRVRAPEQVERQSKAVSEILLQIVHLRAVLLHRQSSVVSGQLRRGAVFVRGTNKEDFVPPRALETRIRIGRQHRADKITEVLYPIDVRQR